MVEKRLDHFDIAQICDSGQCFRMRKLEERKYCVIASEKYLEIEQKGDVCRFFCEEEEFESFWKDFFDLDTDYEAYISQANPNDKYLNQAIAFGSGIRILHQDLWEMIVSFLISQQNNITRIRKCIANICEKYGEERENFRGEVYHTFPTPEAFAGLPEDALKECNLGYRSKYVVRTARSIVNGEVDLDEIKKMPYKKAKEELLELFGIGEKVADCICLFALHHLQAFPVDTHIRQALDAHYKRGFPRRRYKGFEGVMQQYIFYWELRRNTVQNTDKEKFYRILKVRLQGLVDGVPYPLANLANASALLYQELANINWAGFYLMEDGVLVLGPFQGKPACVKIAVGKGVCGTAVAEDASIMVRNVHTFPGHIACDAASKSEIVIPIHKDEQIVGVLDIDSPHVARFDEEDKEGLEQFVKVLEKYISNI